MRMSCSVAACGDISFSGLSEDLASTRKGSETNTDTKPNKLMLTITRNKLSHTS